MFATLCQSIRIAAILLTLCGGASTGHAAEAQASTDGAANAAATAATSGSAAQAPVSRARLISMMDGMGWG